MRSVELFAGAGGLGIGADRAGFHPVLVVERDRWCCDTLRENRGVRNSPIKGWPEPHEGDVREVDFSTLKRIDVVTGGPPCQPFSVGGKHRAHGDTRDLWVEAVRAVRETQPKAFIFENVKGLTRQSFASYFNYILLQLQHPSMFRKHGEEWEEHMRRLERKHTGKDQVEYRVVCELKNTADYGVPQKRERVVFVGFRADVNAEWSFPRETHSQEALLYQQFVSGEYWERHGITKRERAISASLVARGQSLDEEPETLPWQTVRDALSDLPDPERNATSGKYFNHRLQEGARAYPGHTGSPIDEPAKTLKAGVHGVPGGENMLRRSNGSVRYFTVRESARLQAFPDQYVLHGAWSEAMRQLGNAVPVTFAETVAKSVRRHLEAARTN